MNKEIYGLVINGEITAVCLFKSIIMNRIETESEKEENKIVAIGKYNFVPHFEGWHSSFKEAEDDKGNKYIVQVDGLNGNYDFDTKLNKTLKYVSDRKHMIIPMGC